MFRVSRFAQLICFANYICDAVAEMSNCTSTTDNKVDEKSQIEAVVIASHKAIKMASHTITIASDESTHGFERVRIGDYLCTDESLKKSCILHIPANDPTNTNSIFCNFTLDPCLLNLMPVTNLDRPNVNVCKVVARMTYNFCTYFYVIML